VTNTPPRRENHYQVFQGGTSEREGDSRHLYFYCHLNSSLFPESKTAVIRYSATNPESEAPLFVDNGLNQIPEGSTIYSEKFNF
jgi:hypothetical protein